MDKTPQLIQLAEKILNDPILLQKLSDKVYQLFQTDIRHQLEQTHGSYGRRR